MPDLNTSAGAVGWENAPNHYKGNGGVENFDVWDIYELDPYSANAFKYLARWDKKGSALNDLRKADHYLAETILRWDDGRIRWHSIERAKVKGLPVETVIESFGLTGYVATAVFHLLSWKVSLTPDQDLRAAKRYAERAIKEYLLRHPEEADA